MTETPTASPTWMETLVATITGETLTPSPTVKPDDALATPTLGPTVTFPVMPGVELTPALAFPSPEALALDLEPEQPLPVLESTDFRDPHDVDWEFTEPVMEPSADGTYWLHFRTPYAVRARLPDQNNVTLTLNLRMTGGRVSIRTHYTEGIGYYRFSLSADGLLELARGETVVASVRLVPVQPEHWRSLRLAVTGRSLRASIDGAMVLHYVDRAPLPPGQVWMAVDGIPTGEVWIDNVQMTGSIPRAEIAPPPIDMAAADVGTMTISGQPVVIFDYYMNPTTGDHDLYRMNIDGSNLTPLPNNTAFKEYEPVLSPSGTQIAFTSWRDANNTNIWIMKTDGTGLTQVTTHASFDYSPVWSADGTKIAFVSNRGGIERVYIINANTTEAQTQPTMISTGRDPAWSPTGSNELVISDYNPASYTYDLYIVFLNTGTRSWLAGQVDAGGARAEISPTWSSDGTYILFTSIIYVGTEPQFTLRRVQRSNPANIEVVSAVKDAVTADYGPGGNELIWRLTYSVNSAGFARASSASPFGVTHYPVNSSNGNTFNPDWGNFQIGEQPAPNTVTYDFRYGNPHGFHRNSGGQGHSTVDCIQYTGIAWKLPFNQPCILSISLGRWVTPAQISKITVDFTVVGRAVQYFQNETWLQPGHYTRTYTFSPTNSVNVSGSHTYTGEYPVVLVHWIDVELYQPPPTVAYRYRFAAAEGSNAYTTAQMNAIEDGIDATVNAFLRITSNPNYPGDVFNRILVGGSSTDNLWFIRANSTTNTAQGSGPEPDVTVNLPGVDTFTYADINNGICKTFGRIAPRPAAIICNGNVPNGNVAINQFTIVHELGHMFDYRVGYPNNGGISIALGLNQSFGVRDCSGEVVIGEDSNQSVTWTRGEAGWGSGPAASARDSNGNPTTRLISNYQQNPTFEFPPAFPTGKGVTEIFEAAADMFLNWVYRVNSDLSFPPTRLDCSNPSSLPPPGHYVGSGFVNRNWEGQTSSTTTPGTLDTRLHGDIRHSRMHEIMVNIFAANTGW